MTTSILNDKQPLEVIIAGQIANVAEYHGYIIQEFTHLHASAPAGFLLWSKNLREYEQCEDGKIIVYPTQDHVMEEIQKKEAEYEREI